MNHTMNPILNQTFNRIKKRTMNRFCWNFPKTLAAIAVALVTAGAHAAPVEDPVLGQAHLAYYEGRFSRSLSIYEQLAAAGNAEAAERAGFMLFHGEAHYGHQVHRDPGRAMAFLTQAANAGRSGASFMLNLIDLSN